MTKSGSTTNIITSEYCNISRSHTKCHEITPGKKKAPGSKLLHVVSPDALWISDAISYMPQLADSDGYLKSQVIAHGHLNPENAQVDLHGGTLKIIVFGLTGVIWKKPCSALQVALLIFQHLREHVPMMIDTMELKPMQAVSEFWPICYTRDLVHLWILLTNEWHRWCPRVLRGIVIIYISWHCSSQDCWQRCLEALLYGACEDLFSLDRETTIRSYGFVYIRKQSRLT